MKTSFLSWTMAAVALSALVACGDDTTGSGGSGPGAGGAGGGDAATTTTTTGGPASTSTSTGGDGGGGGDTTSQGGGGSGGGIPADCEVIELGEFDAPVSYGYIAPFEIDEDLEDFVQVGIFQNTEGEIALGEGVNATLDTCAQCVLAFVDDDAEAQTTAGLFFATAGTLTLPDGFAGEGSISGVQLIEVDQATGELIEDGRCLYVTEATFEYDNPIPAEWDGTLAGCSPGYYADELGCDCACGAYDPDCTDAEQTIYNCQGGQTCSEEAVCEGVPTAWECEDAAFDDGTTCNCDCGALDPDCDAPANPIVGCDAGFTCVQDTCIPPDEEGLCEDLSNNDLDSNLDCSETECQDEAECAPGAGARNSICETHSDCSTEAGNDPLCIPGQQNQCSEWCDLDANDCAAGELCIEVGGWDQGACVTECDPDGDDCPADFTCDQLDEAGTMFGCFAGPPAGWTCEDAYYGTQDGCDCGCGVVDPDCVDATVASCQACSELSCANDGTAFGCANVEINPVDNSQCVL